MKPCGHPCCILNCRRMTARCRPLGPLRPQPAAELTVTDACCRCSLNRFTRSTIRSCCDAVSFARRRCFVFAPSAGIELWPTLVPVKVFWASRSTTCQPSANPLLKESMSTWPVTLSGGEGAQVSFWGSLVFKSEQNQIRVSKRLRCVRVIFERVFGFFPTSINLLRNLKL